MGDLATAVSSDVRAQLVPSGGVRVEKLDEVGGTLLEQAWDLYEAAFREINALAVQRHLMHRDEFDEVMADSRVGKYLAFDDAGDLVGLSTYTNQLDAFPLISPAYFERHWPEHFAAGRVWYIGFVAVAPEGRHRHTFFQLIETMYEVSAVDNGISAMDFCQYNVDVRKVPYVTKIVLERIAAAGGRVVRPSRIDAQVVFLYEFWPAP
jgi:hypothetical protein